MDVINCAEFCANRLRSCDSVGGQNLPSPIDISHLPQPVIKGINQLSYDERLENLGLSRLTTRRVDLIRTFNIINRIDKVDKSLFFDSAGVRVLLPGGA